METDLSGLGELAADPRLVRGAELWRLGMTGEARAEFEDLRQAVKDNPAQTYRLARAICPSWGCTVRLPWPLARR